MRYGLDQKCARVRATDIPVLKLEEGDPATLYKIRSEIRESIEQTIQKQSFLGVPGWRILWHSSAKSSDCR